MNTRYGILSGLIILALISLAGVCAAEETTTVTGTATAPFIAGDPADEEIAPYDGPIGPGNPLYGLKVAFEDLDETFTFNETERFNKQLNNAKIRLSEAKRELMLNRTETADEALDLYWQKVNLTEMRLAIFNSSNATGLLHAQEMITRHQMVLEGLMLSHPNNTGLARAYNNSLKLEEKFENKTRMKFERVMEKNNKTVLKAFRLGIQEQERTLNEGVNKTVRIQQDQQGQTDVNGQGRNTGNSQDTSKNQGQQQAGNQDGKGNANQNQQQTGNQNTQNIHSEKTQNPGQGGQDTRDQQTGKGNNKNT